MKKVWALLLLSWVFCHQPAWAIESAYSANYTVPSAQSGFYDSQYEVESFKKLERGAKNFFLGSLEIPHGIKSEVYYRKQEYLPVGIETYVLGTVKGCANAFGRTAVGFFEAITFPFPQKPILQEMEEWLY